MAPFVTGYSRGYPPATTQTKIALRVGSNVFSLFI